MIKAVKRSEMGKCVRVIRESFATVAAQFGLTEQNCPNHTSFIKEERLIRQYDQGRPIYAYMRGEKIIGCFSLQKKEDGSCELNNLAVLPGYRHRGYGKEMIAFAAKKAKAMGCGRLTAGIMEENSVLKDWYISQGFTHTGTKKFEHLPFTVGFMEMPLLFLCEKKKQQKETEQTAAINPARKDKPRRKGAMAKHKKRR